MTDGQTDGHLLLYSSFATNRVAMLLKRLKFYRDATHTIIEYTHTERNIYINSVTGNEKL